MSKRLTTENFITRSKIIHTTEYDYSEVVYNNSKEKVVINCNTHGSFLQIPNAHLRGIGCPRCSGKAKSNTNEFITKSRAIHGDKYNYSHVKYISARRKIQINCPKHGTFIQTPNSHLNGFGCIKCGFLQSGFATRKTLTQFITESKIIHGNRYDYNKTVYINNHSKLEIICSLHGPFWQTPHIHLHRDKCGCPKCNLSKGEHGIIRFLQNNDIKYEYQKTFNDCRNPKTNCKLKFDFYIPSKNLLIEFDGAQHYMFGNKLGNYITDAEDLKNIQFRDMIKTQYASRNGIRLLRIKFSDLQNIPQFISQSLL